VTGGAPVQVAPAPSPSRPRNDYVSLDEAKSTFPNFRIEQVGNKARISGVVFTACRHENPNFRVESMIDRDQAKFGFFIDDKNGVVRTCMARMKASNNCQTADCATFSQELELPAEHDAKISLFQRGEFSVSDRYDSTWIETPVADYVGTITKAKAEADKQANARQERIAELERDYQGCKNVPDHLDVAYDSIEKLLRAGGLDDEEAEKRQKEVAANEFNILVRNSGSQDCSAHIDEMREQAQDFVSRNREYADRIASKVYANLARCVLAEGEDKELSATDFATAKELLDEAGKIPGVTSKTRTELTRHQKDLKMGRARFYAQQGSEGYAEYLTARNRIQQDLYRQMQQSCSRAMRSMEAAVACQTAQRDLQRIPSMLDQDMRQAMQREQQWYAQMYQQQWLGYGGGQMNGQFGGGFNPSPNLGGPTPLVGAPQQPQMMAGGMPQSPPMMAGGVPQAFQAQQGPQGPMWQGGAYGSGANPLLNY
jgi:hypothetical protein